jgi:hypothetical protein
MTIVGNGSTTARAASAPAFRPFRLLAVSLTGDLTLEDLTLTGGRTGESAFGDSLVATSGGGVYNGAPPL